MTHHQLIGRHVSEFLHLLGLSLAVPDRPPDGDPEYGLDRYIECLDRGLAIMLDANDVCCCVQYFGVGKDPSYTKFTAGLPGGVGFKNSRAEARTIMGPPVRSSDGSDTVSGIEHRPWDLFTRDGLKVHLEYAEGGDRILLVSVTPSSTAG